MSYAPKTRIRIRTFTGPGFLPEWKETGTVMKPRAVNGKAPDKRDWPESLWNIIKFDTGGQLCIHDGSLMADNAR